MAMNLCYDKSNARHMAGLSKEKWLEIIRQYSEFENKYKENKE